MSFAESLRIIDANLNRTGEGLRILEDIARFVLNDTGLTQQLKDMRHTVLEADTRFNSGLLQHRNSPGDVGVNLASPGEARRELPLIAVANSRRVQESLRTIEELAKLPDSSIDPEKFKQSRFRLYEIERDLVGKLLRKDKTERIKGLYAIIDTGCLEGRSHIDAALQLIRGGAKIIQLRDKIQKKKVLLPVARELRELCAKNNVLFIMNDYLDIGLDVDADGLHLGQDDLPIPAARRLLPIDKILGCSADTAEEAAAAQAEGADYIGLGAVYQTGTKGDCAVCGLDTLRAARKAVSIPIVAIGGINLDNASDVIKAGADSVAVISAILKAADPEKATRRFSILFEVEKN